jgi:hypothetical protein
MLGLRIKGSNMTITISQMLSKISLDLQEGSNTGSGDFNFGLWTAAEIMGYINYALGCFLNDTGVVITDNTITASIGTSLYTRPTNAADIDRISFNGKRLRRVSSFDLASRDYKWRSRSGIPQFYHEDGIQISSFELDKMPTSPGAIRIFADLLPSEVTNTTDVFPMPDCWEPYIRWETISFCLQKDGEAQDLPRAEWAHNKYLFGVSLAQRIVAGQSDQPIMQIGQQNE